MLEEAIQLYIEGMEEPEPQKAENTQPVRISRTTGKPVHPYHCKSEETRMKRRNNAPTTALEKVSPTANAACLDFTSRLMQIAQGTNQNDLDTLRNAFVQYINLCGECNMKLGNLAAYAAMGISKYEIFDWEHGRRRVNQPEYKEFAMQVKRVLAAYRETVMSLGEVNPIVGIFWQKAYDGLNEMAEVDVVDTGTGESLSAQQIADKYDSLLPDE